jgi:hypothetical protein
MALKILRMIATPLIIIAGVYIVICAYVYFFQNRFIYYPTRDIEVTPDLAGMPYEDVFLDVSPADRINGWYIPGRPDRRTVLFLHGNGGNIGHRIPHLQFLHSLGVSVLIIDYRGYGRSSGSPSEEKLYADATAAYHWLIRTKQVAPDRIIIWGESIGGAVAVELATKSPCAGLILESSFTSLRDMARRVFGFLPTGLLLRSEFSAVDKLARLSIPALVTHSPDDDIVPYEMGRKLFEAAHPPKRFIELSGGHNDRKYLTNSEYIAAVDTFLTDPARAY